MLIVLRQFSRLSDKLMIFFPLKSSSIFQTGFVSYTGDCLMARNYDQCFYYPSNEKAASQIYSNKDFWNSSRIQTEARCGKVLSQCQHPLFSFAYQWWGFSEGPVKCIYRENFSSPWLVAFPRDWIRQSSGRGECQANSSLYVRSLIMELLKGKHHLLFGRKVSKGKISPAWQKQTLLPTCIPMLQILSEKHIHRVLRHQSLLKCSLLR